MLHAIDIQDFLNFGHQKSFRLIIVLVFISPTTTGGSSGGSGGRTSRATLEGTEGSGGENEREVKG